MAYGIVKQHEGWIQVISRVGEGTCFIIFVPAEKNAGEAEAAVKPIVNLETYRGAKERILLIEDEAQVLEFSSRALQEYGYEVVKASTAKQAQELFSSEPKGFDLVLCDVVLPDKNGVRLTEELSAQKPGLKIILSSGYADNKSQWAQIEQRGIPFLQKPYSLTELFQTIRDVLTRV